MASKKCNFPKAIISIVLFLIALIIVFALVYFNSQKMKNDQNDQKNQEPIGGQRDEHGCLGPAGYSWCESSQKCLRIWEEACNDNIFNTMEKLQNAINMKFTEVGPTKFIWKVATGSVVEEIKIPGFRYVNNLGSNLQLQNIEDWLYENGFTRDELNIVKGKVNVQTGHLRDNLICIVGYFVNDYKNITVECGILLPSMLPKVSLEEQLKEIFAKKYNQDAAEVRITITDSTDSHVRGGVSFSPDGSAGGGIFLATKTEGDEWKLVFDGNGSYRCDSVAEYGFPNVMISDCAQDDTIVKPVAKNISVCLKNSDCIPLPSECHPLRCINKEFEGQFKKPEMCTEMFAMNAAYSPEDCVCLEGACENKNNL